MIEAEDVDELIGADALDERDDRIGEISQVYIDADTSAPTWVSVRLGLLHGTEVMVPLEGAEWDAHALHAAVSRDVAKEAPRLESDEPMTQLDQERLYTHYGIPTVRHPRCDIDLDVDAGDVCYSVRDDLPVEQEPISVTGRELQTAGGFSRAS
jgi:hypothetical protein